MARKIFEFGDNFGAARIVRVGKNCAVLEIRDGQDWLGRDRWYCASIHRTTSKHFLTIKNDRGESQRVLDEEWVRKMLNEMADELYRRAKRRKPLKG